MISFPGQYDGFRVSKMGDRIISFRIDEMYADSVKEVVSMKIGTEFVVNLIDVTGSTDLGVETDEKSLRERFNNKMHLLLAQWAEIIKDTPENTKLQLKDWLKEKKLIQSSTKELDLRSLALACNYIEHQIKQCKE